MKKHNLNVSPKERPALSKTDLGEASRQMICARLMLNGITVFMPMTEDTPTDLLVMNREGTVYKCQCKYIFPTKNGSHFMPLYSMRKNGAGSKSVKHVYTDEEVDFFLGYCNDNDTVYVIPKIFTGSRKSLAFWILRNRTGANGYEQFDSSSWMSRFDLLK